MPDALLQQGFTLLILAVFLFVAIGLGRLVLSGINTPFTSFGEMIFYSSGIGFGVAGYCIFFLGLFDGFHPLPIRIQLIFLLVVSLAGWMWAPKPSIKGNLQKLYSPWNTVAFFLLLLCLSAGLLLTLTPEIGKDALIYHLAVPKLFLKHQGFTFIPGNIFSNYPLHSEMLFLAGLYLQGDILAKGLHFIMLLMILLGMDQFIRYRMRKHDFPVLSLLIFSTIPSVFLIAHMAYNDLFVTFYSMAAVFAFIIWHDRSEKAWLILSGLFTGLAMASKYTSLLLPFLGCLGVLWAARDHRFRLGGALRHLLLYVSVLTIVGSPFYLKNWIVTGNPFYPFLYSIFGGRGWDPQQAQFYDFFVQSLGMGRTILDYILLPWNLSFLAKMDSPQFDGIIGPIFIATLPFAIGIRRPAMAMKIMGTYCFMTFLFWASSAQQIRYLIPAFPFLAIIAGSILTHYKKNKAIMYLLVFLISGSLALNGYHVSRDFMKIAPVPVIVGKEDRHAFLGRMLPSYGMFDFMNRHLAQDAKIFLIYMKNFTFLCDRECYSDAMFESYTIEKMLSRASTPAEVYSMLAESNFTHILFDINYIHGPLSTLTPSEQDLFRAFTKEHLELARADRSYFLYRIKE
ncbi:MAG: glycosyltransferase family 39 protein [Deltaproteobacteria bacterium]|nr:glycosyltransferase family 39 protein [Deltaproteobacteria bacterium]